VGPQAKRDQALNQADRQEDSSDDLLYRGGCTEEQPRPHGYERHARTATNRGKPTPLRILVYPVPDQGHAGEDPHYTEAQEGDSSSERYEGRSSSDPRADVEA
jgi:hypothetical protein